MSSRRSIDNSQSPRSRPTSSNNPSFSNDTVQRPGQLHSRRSSVASSVGGVLPSPGQRFRESIAESGNNAISTLLQPPIVRTGLLPHTTGPSAQRPSTRDIPPVTLSPIPPVDDKLFKDYISQAGSLYDSFKRSKENVEEKRPQLAHRLSSVSDVTQTDNTSSRRGPPSPTLSRSESASTIAGSDSPSRRRTSGSGRRGGPTVAPLSTIPGVYFEEDFKLENPRTFDVVSERAEIVRSPASGSAVPPGGTGKKALAANAILQEKLSWYMDTVEIHLISSISTASSSFFAALGSLRELHAEAEESVTKIQTLRSDLQQLDEGMAQSGLKIVAMKRRRENVRKLSEAVSQLEEIQRVEAECEQQVERGEIEEALRGLVTVERLMAGDASDLPDISKTSRPLAYRGTMLDLRGLQVLDGVNEDIRALRRRIGEAFKAKFIDILLGDLRRHVDEVSLNSTLTRWDKASSRLRGAHVRTPSEMPAYMHIDGELRSALLTQLKGLARSNAIKDAAEAYRAASLREFKKLIRRHLPSSNDDDANTVTSNATTSSIRFSADEKSSILARNLRALDEQDAENMFKKIYANVGEALRRLGIQVKVLLDITSTLGNPQANLPLKSPAVRSPLPTPRSATHNGLLTPQVDLHPQLHSPGPAPSLVRQDEIQEVLDLSSLLGKAVDAAQNQIIKVLNARKQQTSELDPTYFLRYFALNRLFIDECEAVSGKAGEALLGMVHEHIKVFVMKTSEIQKQSLVQTMDTDQWDAQDFSSDDTARLDTIVENSTKTNEIWTKMTYLWDEEPSTQKASTTNGTVNGETSTEETPAEGKEKARAAVLDEERYLLPASAITVLKGIELYERLIQGMPAMSTDICGNLLNYIKLYNSRSSQLILGAGATRSAGLRNITTRHLALSSQALNFITAVMPYVREFARRYLPGATSVIADFDDTKRGLQEHRVGIQDKLIEIMTGRSTAHVNTMKSIDWNVKRDSTNAYMETLMRESMTLHKVLVRHLPSSNVKMIMDPVISNYRDQWGQAFQDVTVSTDVAKQNLVRDAQYFKSRISKIGESGDIGDYLLGIAESKSVASTAPAVVTSDSAASTG